MVRWIIWLEVQNGTDRWWTFLGPDNTMVDSADDANRFVDFDEALQIARKVKEVSPTLDVQLQLVRTIENYETVLNLEDL